MLFLPQLIRKTTCCAFLFLTALLLFLPLRLFGFNEALQTMDLPMYQKVNDLPSGKLLFTGSESINPLLLAWAKQFIQMYPQVSIVVEGGGSGRAAEALMENPLHILAPMSRELTSKQLADFHDKYGYDPMAIRIALDAVAIYVNKENPLRSISVRNLERIYNEDKSDDLLNWGGLGLQGSWAKKTIHPLGRNHRSGTYGLFQEMALKSGEQSPAVPQLGNPWNMVDAIEADPCAIGYASVGVAMHPGIKLLPIIGEEGVPVAPTRVNCLSGAYPLARSLYIYVGSRPGAMMSSIQKEFFQYIFSQEGQNTVVRYGMFALQSAMAAKMLRRVQTGGLILE